MKPSSLSVILGILLLTPTVGHAQKKNTGRAQTVPATPEEYALLNQQKEVRGTLITRDPEKGADAKGKRSLLIRYDFEVIDVNPNYKPTRVAPPRDFTSDVLQLQMKVANAMQIPNFQKRMAALQQLATEEQQLLLRMQKEQLAYVQREVTARENDIRTGNVPYIKVQQAKEFELEIQDDVVIRRLQPAMEYDDKGFLKEYTKEELEKLNLVDNADKKKPGYPAKYEGLVPKQTVLLILTPGKNENPDKTAKADQPASIIGKSTPVKPTVSMIVIVEDIPNPHGIGDGNSLPPLKKKKK